MKTFPLARNVLTLPRVPDGQLHSAQVVVCQVGNPEGNRAGGFRGQDGG